MSELHNPSAFPVQFSIDGNWCKEPIPDYCGMTLRDWFAGKALEGLILQSGLRYARERTETVIDIAVTAYALADAMLEARK